MYTNIYSRCKDFFFFGLHHMTFLKSLNINFSWKGVCPPQIYRNNMNISKNLALSYMIIQLYDCYNVDYKGSGCL